MILDQQSSTNAGTLRYPPGTAYANGEFCEIAEAKLSVLDWGFLRSDATYDVVHVWKGRFFCEDRHIDRFLLNLERMRLSLPFDRARLIEILHECVRRSGLEDAYVEMICTRGISPTFSRDPRDARNNFVAFAIPFGWIANEEQRRRGLKLIISKIPRIAPQSVDPRIKNYHWLDLVSGMFEAYDRGAENAVLVDLDGNITEGPGFNIFAVADGALLTPAAGVLEGITRGVTKDLAKELGINLREGTLTADALRGAHEVFITSTAGGVMPVTEIDGAPVGNGGVGTVTSAILDLYWQKHSDPTWSTAV